LQDLQKLRELATWYREFAERAGSPAIWESRLRTSSRLADATRRAPVQNSTRDVAARRLGESRHSSTVAKH